MRNENGGSPRIAIFGLLIILIGSFLFLDFMRARKGGESLISWSNLIDYGSVSRKIHFAIGETLSDMGISSKNLVLQYPEEKREGKIEWIHFTEQVRVPNARTLEEYRASIEKAVKKVGGKIISYRTFEENDTESLMMIIGIKSIVTYSLTLEQPQEKK